MAVFIDISMSLDGYVAGPNQTLEEPLGRGRRAAPRLGGSARGLARAARAGGRRDGPRRGPLQREVDRIGAVIMGRRMFSGGSGPWESDPNADAWWGDDPPFHVPVFVLTHHEREPVEKEGGTTFTFVTDGFESALEQARAAAGDKDVSIAGGAEAAQQASSAGVVDDITLHIAPVLLGGGASLFGGVGTTT